MDLLRLEKNKGPWANLSFGYHDSTYHVLYSYYKTHINQRGIRISRKSELVKRLRELNKE